MHTAARLSISSPKHTSGSVKHHEPHRLSVRSSHTYNVRTGLRVGKAHVRRTIRAGNERMRHWTTEGIKQFQVGIPSEDMERAFGRIGIHQRGGRCEVPVYDGRPAFAPIGIHHMQAVIHIPGGRGLIAMEVSAL